MKNIDSSEKKTPATGWVLTVFKRINDWLFKPSVHITEVGERKHAEFIAKLALFFAALIIVGLPRRSCALTGMWAPPQH